MELRERTPRLMGIALAVLVAAEVVHSAWSLRQAATEREPPGVTMPRVPPSRLDIQLVVDAHLFGGTPHDGAPGGDDIPDTRRTLVLSGIIAGKDPKSGCAILGPQGAPTKVYFAGSALSDAEGARLYQVFADRVVLDFGGRLETLRLPRHSLPGFTAAGAPGTETAAAADPEAAPETTADAPQPTPAESLLSYLAAEQSTVAGGITGMVLHPVKLMRIRYGFEDGDQLTAVNGVQITDPNVLADMLKTSGNSLSLTFTRAGVQQTKTVQLSN